MKIRLWVVERIIGNKASAQKRLEVETEIEDEIKAEACVQGFIIIILVYYFFDLYIPQ